MPLLSACCMGSSPRQIEGACAEGLAYRVLTGHQQPDHSQMSAFRRRDLHTLEGVFLQILRRRQGEAWRGRPMDRQPTETSATTAARAYGSTDVDNHLLRSGGPRSAGLHLASRPSTPIIS